MIKHNIWNIIVKTPTPTQLNLNITLVGLDMKMTLQTTSQPTTTHHQPPTQTQCQQYFSCYLRDFDETIKGRVLGTDSNSHGDICPATFIHTRIYQLLLTRFSILTLPNEHPVVVLNFVIYIIKH